MAKEKEEKKPVPMAISNIKKPLESVIARIEELVDQRKGINDDIKDIMTEAEGNGLDKKTIRKILAIRKLDPGDFQEQEFLRDQYLLALGLVSA